MYINKQANKQTDLDVMTDVNPNRQTYKHIEKQTFKQLNKNNIYWIELN